MEQNEDRKKTEDEVNEYPTEADIEKTLSRAEIETELL